MSSSNHDGASSAKGSRDSAGATSRGAEVPRNSLRLAGAILWVVIVLAVGALVASLSLERFGELGMLVIWPIGWSAGLVAKKILGCRSKLVGGLLVTACLAIAVLAEVSWIQANIKDAEDSWFKAVTLLPAFVRQFWFAALTACCASIFGAISGWQQVAVRYVRVRVDD